jgi:iron complex outermembrane receptor protein
MSYSALRNSVSMLALLAASSALAGENDMAAASAGNMVAANSATDTSVFGLGQIEQVTITGSPVSQAVSESKISKEDIYTFNALTVTRALDLTTGVETGATGGPRNEQLFFVRGFDRFQSPLFIDGIRVYLPADNRLDTGFFPTANIAQIQVDKGYVSVLSGPGALGGAVNIVTRKPTDSFEYEGRAGIQLGVDGYNGYNTSALVGGNDGKFYWQTSGVVTKLDHFSLSDDFVPTPTQGGGIRDHSDARNYSLNLKAGITPRGSDEYSLSYTGTWGQKDATFSVTDPVATQKDWRWPYWNVQSLYFLSQTGLGTAYVKTKAYYNWFANGLFSYDNANYNTQTTSKAFRSYYADDGFGGSIEVGNDFGSDLLKGAFFYRRDTHTKWQTLYSPVFTEPFQTSIEDTFSFAVENRFHVTDRIDFVAGASYDWRHLLQAQDYVDPTINAKGVVIPGTFVNYPLADGHAPNAQGALIYNYDDTGHVYFNISDRARFPTLFERFSTRFGTTLSNPNLKDERAINYEIGAGDNVLGNTRLDGAIFYSNFTNGLENVPILFCDTTSAAAKNCTGAGGLQGVQTAVSQTQNVGNGKYAGFELSGDSRIMDNLLLGLRYTYINRNLDAQNPANPPLPATFHLTGVPYSQLMAYATWNVLPNVSVTPNVQFDSDRWSNQSSNTNVYLKTGAFFMVNIQADWQITEMIDLQAGARNLTDDNYQLTAGFPSEGRSFFLNFRIRS